MKHYNKYLQEIKKRRSNGLNPKPIDGDELLNDIIVQIKDKDSLNRKEALNFFIYNVLPGTTSAAKVKAEFLKQIILNQILVEEITSDFAFTLLSHMKGGPSIKVLIDLLLQQNQAVSIKALDVLKTQVFLYEADTNRIKEAYNNGNKLAKDLLISYSNAEFFTRLPELDEKIEVVTYVAGIGDISTDLLSPGSDAHSRSDRELHGKCIFEHDLDLQNFYKHCPVPHKWDNKPHHIHMPSMNH